MEGADVKCGLRGQWRMSHRHKNQECSEEGELALGWAVMEGFLKERGCCCVQNRGGGGEVLFIPGARNLQLYSVDHEQANLAEAENLRRRETGMVLNEHEQESWL